MKARDIVCLAVLVMICPTAYATASFQGLGRLTGTNSSVPHGVSADGRVVVGYVQWTEGGHARNQAFRWSGTEGMVGLDHLPGGAFINNSAYAASADGSVVVGRSTSASTSQYGGEACVWRQGTGPVGLGDLDGGVAESKAFGVSADGSVVVGASNSRARVQAFRWTQETGMVGLGYSGWAKWGEAYGVSADGSVVVGRNVFDSPSYTHSEAFRWTQDAGMVDLGVLPGQESSWAFAVSADGSVVVGRSYTVTGVDVGKAFRWTEETGMVALGDLAGGGTDSGAYGVSGDGSIVVGSVGGNAFIWDADNGMRSLKGVLETDYGLNLTGWRLREATDVSDDGSVIIGRCSSPDRLSHVYIAVIPEPVTLEVDIRPGSHENPVNLKSKGVISVAVLGSEDFDVTQVVQETLEFAGAQPRPKGKSGNIGSLEDVNGDGFTDLVLHYPTPDLQLDPADTEATLTGELLDGTQFVGTDSVQIVGNDN